MTEPKSPFRRCKSCGQERKLGDFRKQGRGRLHVCKDCLPTMEGVGTRSFERIIAETLTEIAKLLRSPRCSVCGGCGATNRQGPRSWHSECDPRGMTI